jgi:phospholipase A-2-activating protein
MKGHNNFVSSVCIIKPSKQYPNGCIITGSNDSYIFIYNSGELEPAHKIKAHEDTVCALHTSNLDTESFLTSSWDITAKLWNLNNLRKPKMIFTGHTAAVWCVSDLPNGSIVTGAADKTVNVHLLNGRILHKLKGHTDCVRDIAVINENEFLTCANDAVIKRWNAVTGDNLGDFYGHSNYIYSMSALHGGNLVVSSGEDKSIRVWLKGEIHQSITLPTQSVWCVKFLPNEDIVCGASDGIIRIFTTDTKRYADSETIQKFEESVANTEQTQEFGGLKTNE